MAAVIVPFVFIPFIASLRRLKKDRRNYMYEIVTLENTSPSKQRIMPWMWHGRAKEPQEIDEIV